MTWINRPGSYLRHFKHMRYRNSPSGYGAVPLFLHWVTVVLVIIAWTTGTFDDVLPKGAARAAGMFVHNTAGLAILVALILRLLWRVGDPPPPPNPRSSENGSIAPVRWRIMRSTLCLSRL